MVKKRATKKTAGKRKSSSAGGRGDRSRLDLRPLQKHIRRRIADLKKQKKGPGPAAAGVGPQGGSVDETIERLESALETLIDICHPTMDIPI